MRDAIILEYVTLLNVKHCKMDIRLAIELNTKAIYTHLPQRQFDLSVTLQSITAEHGSFGAIIRNENESKGRVFTTTTTILLLPPVTTTITAALTTTTTTTLLLSLLLLVVI